MKLKNLSLEELELMSYEDIALIILKDAKKPMNTPTLFQAVCDALNFGKEEYTNKIGDFYTILTTDKRFVLLEKGEWDLRDNHAVEIVIDDEDDDTEVEIEEDEEEEAEENIDVELPDEDVEVDDDIEDDMEDLTLVDEDEIEESVD